MHQSCACVLRYVADRQTDACVLCVFQVMIGSDVADAPTSAPTSRTGTATTTTPGTGTKEGGHVSGPGGMSGEVEPEPEDDLADVSDGECMVSVCVCTMPIGSARMP